MEALVAACPLRRCWRQEMAALVAATALREVVREKGERKKKRGGKN